MNYIALDAIAETVFSYCPNLRYMDVQSLWNFSERYTRTPGETGSCQSQTLTSNEEEYSWALRHHFITDN